MRIMRFAATLLVLLASGVVLGPRPSTVEAAAGPQPFIALLNGGQILTPTGSNETGIGFFWFDKSIDELCYAITHSIPDADATSASIRVGPLNFASGAAATTLGSTGNSPFEDCTTLNKPFQKRLKKGELHVLVNSTAFTNGEIRGQIVPSSK